MAPTFTIDATKFNRQMAAVYDALVGAGQIGDAATIVEDETRLLLKQAIRFTPPKSLAQGRNAVQRDIRRAMTPAEETFFVNPRIKKLIKDDNIEGFKSFLSYSGGWKGWTVEQFDPALHQSARDNRGRVQRQKKRYILEFAAWKKYVSQVQQHVGFMRAGWMPAFTAVGGKVASWISRHSRPSGFVEAYLTGEKPSITIGNQTKGIGQTRHQFESALRTRMVAMRNRVKLILSGYSKDVAQGLRPRKHAVKTPAGAFAE